MEKEEGRGQIANQPKFSIQNCTLGRETVSTAKPQTESSSDIFPLNSLSCENDKLLKLQVLKEIFFPLLS